VVTDKRLPKNRAGRSAIAFYYRKGYAAISEGLKIARRTRGAAMKVSSVERRCSILALSARRLRPRQWRNSYFSDIGITSIPGKVGHPVCGVRTIRDPALGHLLNAFGHGDRARIAAKGPAPVVPLCPWVET